MGLLVTKRLNEILNKAKLKDYKTFIETGTYTGRSIIPLAQDFKDVEFHTIEIVKDLYFFAKRKAEQKKIKNINFHNGDSPKIIEKLLQEISSDKIIIFLDAHSSGYEGYSAETIEKDSEERFVVKIKNFILRRKKIVSTDTKINQLSNTEVPLINELKIISKFEKNFLIIVDDYDLFGKKYDFADWSNIKESTVKEIFKNSDVTFYNLPKEGQCDQQLIIEKCLN